MIFWCECLISLITQANIVAVSYYILYTMCRDSDGSQIENIFCAKADYLGERNVFFYTDGQRI